MFLTNSMKLKDDRKAIFRRLLLFLTVALTVTGMFAMPAAAVKETDTSVNIYNETDSQFDLQSYTQYVSAHENTQISGDVIVLDADSDGYGAEISAEPEFEGQTSVLRLSNTDTVTWQFSVKDEGLYALCFLYYPVEGDGGTIVRRVTIDGEVPFREAYDLALDRIWANSTGKKDYDLNGNQISVPQQEAPAWREQYAAKDAGTVPFQFFLSAGQHTLELSGVREPMILRSLAFCPPTDADEKPYKEVREEYVQMKYEPVSEQSIITLEGEDAEKKSSQMLFPQTDRTSPSVTPYEGTKTRYNTIGGAQWRISGQWIEWSFEAPESGLYALSAHFKQALQDSHASVRALTVDGKKPFAEAGSWLFDYDSAWQCAWFSNGEGVPYEIYLEKGPHSIRLCASQGPYEDLQIQAQQLLLDLNDIYREIVVVTGSSPDLYRDYRLDQMIPETIERMTGISRRLQELNDMTPVQKGKQRNIREIDTLCSTLDLMAADHENIAKLLGQFKSEIASLGTFINLQAEQPLELDWLRLSRASMPLPKGDAGFFGLSAHYIRQFVASFFTDYSAIGQKQENTEKTVRVWMTAGRDQAQLLREMTVNGFTPDSGIAVNLQLVNEGMLLPSMLSGRGPDVSLNMAQATVNNLALRGALADLDRFDDIAEQKDQFYSASLDAFGLEGSIYALPETLTFPMLFYRKDILKKLNIPLKELKDWDTVLDSVLPKLQRNSLSFGILPGINNYLSISSQSGGALYGSGGKSSALDSAEAIDSMRLYSMLYTQYGLPLSFDFANRFRTGEVPLAVMDYISHNQLAVFAPEIRGLWGMLPIPGMRNADGEVNHTAVGISTGVVMIQKTELPEESWQFSKWWVSDKTQTEYGKKLEALIGAAARYNTANKNALRRMEWDTDMRESILTQSELLTGYPEVPGGYFTARYYDFAFRNIVYDSMDVRESMSYAAENITREIHNKRVEYGLETQ